MEKGRIYKGLSKEVDEYHENHADELEYSLNDGITWLPVPRDLCKIDYYIAWYRLKE